MRIDALEMWCWRRLWRVPWTARRSNQSILKEINPEYSSEGLMLKLMLQYFGTLCEELTHWKRPWCWERLRAWGERGDRRWNGWHHDSMDMRLRKLQEIGKDREAWGAAVDGVEKSQTQQQLNNRWDLLGSFLNWQAFLKIWHAKSGLGAVAKDPFRPQPSGTKVDGKNWLSRYH